MVSNTDEATMRGRPLVVVTDGTAEADGVSDGDRRSALERRREGVIIVIVSLPRLDNKLGITNDALMSSSAVFKNSRCQNSVKAESVRATACLFVEVPSRWIGAAVGQF